MKGEEGKREGKRKRKRDARISGEIAQGSTQVSREE